MALSVTHPYVSAIADSGDTSVVQPSDWNAGHTIAGLGTGVETALGVAIGSSGAFIPNNQAASIAAGTLTTDVKALDLSATWNAAGVPLTGIKFNVTDTASAAASLLMDLQVGGASKFKIKKDGKISVGAGTGTAPCVSLDGATTGLALYSGGNSWGLSSNGVSKLFCFNGGDLFIGSATALGWSNGTAADAGTLDTLLYRDAANTLAQRNGTNAQTLNVYGTWTDASNKRYLSIAMTTAGVASITPTGAGTGASGNVLHISGLPTSNPGPGILWNNAGTPAIGT